MTPDARSYTAHWRVRGYELDGQGHVNNSVYLAYAEEVATLHSEAAGFGRDWTQAQGGLWVVHRQEIVYHRAAVYGDELELTTRISDIRGARACRDTTIRLRDGAQVASVRTEWVWTRVSDGRPTRVPPALLDKIGFARYARIETA